VVPNQGRIFWFSGEIFTLWLSYLFIVSGVFLFKVGIGSFTEWYLFIFASYLVDNHTFLLTNVSAIIWHQIVLVSLSLIKLLLSTKPLFQLQLILAYEPEQGMNESSVGRNTNFQNKQRRNASRKVGNHCTKTSSPKKVVTRLTESDDVITPLLRRAPRLGLALGSALIPGFGQNKHCQRNEKNLFSEISVYLE